MNFRIWLLILFLLPVYSPNAGESLPGWLAEQLPDRSVLTSPGVYPLKNGELLGVGQGKPHQSLRDTRASRMALDSAEHDAKQRIARHLFPKDFARHKSISVGMRRARRVFEQEAEGTSPALVAIVVDPGDVSITPLLDDNVILDARKVVIPQGMLRYLDDPLLQLGGGRIFSREDGWLAVGVGLAPIFGKDSVAERDALKRARLEAGNALVEAIFGGGFEVMEKEAETQIERDGVLSMKEWSSRRTRESAEGELRRAAEVGYWLTDDDHVAVAVAVANPPLDAELLTLSRQDEDDAGIPEYPDWDVDLAWEYALLRHPRLLKGGAVVHPEGGGIWAVGVGAAKLNGNPANDRINAPRAAEMDARRNIVQYLIGFSSQSNTEAVEEVSVIMTEDGMESSSILESLRKITKEKAAGFVRNMRKTGSWKSEDQKLLYQVHIVNIGEVFGTK